MAPSLSPALAAALDVRHATRDSSYGLLNVLAKTDLSVAAAVAPVATQSSGTSGIAIALGVLLAVVGASTIAATWCIAAQRKKFFDLSTIRILNSDKPGQSHVDRDAQHAQVTTAETTTDAIHSVDSADKLPGTVPVATSTPQCVLPPPGLRRKHTRMVAKQRLRIFIPAGVAVPDVELVHSAAPCATPTALTSAVSVSRTLVSRRSIARTPRSALSSGFSAVSSAVIGVVQRREKIEPTMSRGWAPATMVRLPTNPRNVTRTVGMNGTNSSQKMGGRPVRRVLDPSGIAALDSGRCTPVMQVLSNI